MKLFLKNENNKAIKWNSDRHGQQNIPIICIATARSINFLLDNDKNKNRIRLSASSISICISKAIDRLFPCTWLSQRTAARWIVYLG